MLALLWVALSIALGWTVTSLLPLKLRRIEVVGFAIAIGVPASAWLEFALAILLGWHYGLVASFVLIPCICGLAYKYLNQRLEVVNRPYSRRYRFIAWGLAIATALVVSNLAVRSYQFPASSGNWVSNSNVWGDAPLHVALTNQFAHGSKVDLVSPSYMKVPLTYPFLPDFYSGILQRLSHNWQISLMLPSLMMLLDMLLLIYAFGYRILGSARAAWLQYLFIVFSGSLRGAWNLSKILVTKGYAAYNDFVGFSIPFATGDNILNFVHSHPLPQRSYSFGMPLLIVAFWTALELSGQPASNAMVKLKSLLKRKSYSRTNLKK